MRDHRNATPWTVTGCARKRESLKQGAVGRILALTVAVREPRSVYLPPQTPKPQIRREPCLDLDAKENKGAKERNELWEPHPVPRLTCRRIRA